MAGKVRIMAVAVWLLMLCSSSALADTWATVTVLGAVQQSGSLWDSGQFTVTVNGLSKTILYGQFSTPESVAAGIGARFSKECENIASAKAQGATLTFRIKGSGTPSVSITASSVYDTHFSGPSFYLSGVTLVTATTTSLAGTPNPALPSNAIMLKATVTPASNAAGTMTGTVRFLEGSTELGTSAVVAGQATLTLGSLALGTHSIKAYYSGDANYAPSTSITNWAVVSNNIGPSSGSIYAYSLSSFESNGNLTGFNDTVTGSWSFSYDNLNRLAAGDPGSGQYAGQHACWTYDIFGNRTGEAVSGTPCNSSPTPTTWANYDVSNHVTGTTLAPSGYAYDDAGNVNDDGAHQYAYDAENRICAVWNKNTGTKTQYLYGAGGERIAKGDIELIQQGANTVLSCDTASNGFQLTTQYIRSEDGSLTTTLDGSDNWIATDVFSRGMLLATYRPDNGRAVVHYQLTDWLGTRRVQTDNVANKESSWLSLPFGSGLQPVAPAGTDPDATSVHFTGKERDTESGLDYFGARYYNSTTGRWISPDPLGIASGSIAMPQTLNLYSYVWNNPLVLIDPNGMETALYKEGSCFTYTYDTATGMPDGSTTVHNTTTTFGDCSIRGRATEPNVQQATIDFKDLLTGEIKAGRINECQALANYIDAAQQIGGQGIINALAVLTPNTSPTMEKLLGVKTNGGGDTGFYAKNGKSGFMPKYQNSRNDEPGWNGDQSHHFAAFFQSGAAHPKLSMASPAPWIFEETQSYFSPNVGDSELGYAAQDLGQLYGMGVLKPSDVGQAIRSQICQHN